MTSHSTRAAELFAEQADRNYRRTDRLFAGLMGLQFVAGLAMALWISPRTWEGTFSEPHLHVRAALVVGGAILALPMYLALRAPGRPVTRHVVAIGQGLISGLLIHLSGGRIETHFHIFGMLAFLSFYRDWSVLLSASAVVAADHLLRASTGRSRSSGRSWPVSGAGSSMPDGSCSRICS